MNYPWISSERSLNELHQEAKETCNCRKFQESQMEVNQKNVLQKIQILQENLYQNYILQNLFGSDVNTTLKPFFQTEFNSEIVQNIEDFKINKQAVNQFFNLFTKNLSKFASTVNFEKIPSTNDALPFIPFNFYPLQFILYSTLPSIFGYCWCSELAESYIDFIFKAALTNPTFRSPFLALSFSNFIKINTGPVFFRESMQEVIFEIIKKSYVKIKEEELYEYAKQILVNMKENVSLLPRHVRRIIRRFFGIEESRIMSAQQFTVHAMILQPLKQPKEWGITYSTAYLSPLCVNNLNTLGSIFIDATKLNRPSETQTLLNEFISECENVDECSDLLLVSQVMPLMASDSLHLVTTLPDILALVFLVKNSEVSAILKGVAEDIPTNINVPLRFIQIELKEFSQFQITASDAQDITASDDNALTFSFFKFFELADVCDVAPNDLSAFIKFHKGKADLEKRVNVQLILRRLISFCPQENSIEWSDIVPALEDELQRQRVVISLGEESLSKLSVLSERLQKKTEELKAAFESQKAIMYSQIFDAFIDNNQDIKDTFEKRSLGYAYDVEKFYDVFELVSKRLLDFSDKSVFSKIVFNLHTWMMMQIPFDSYRTSHLQFAEDDKMLENPPDNSIDVFCYQPSPNNVKKLFGYKEVFDEATSHLRYARYALIPLLSLQHVNKCINMLNRLFTIEYGGPAQADELTPLIHYLLLSSKIPNLVTFTYYMSDFLSTLNTKGLIQLEEWEVVGLTHLINHVKSIIDYFHSEV